MMVVIRNISNDKYFVPSTAAITGARKITKQTTKMVRSITCLVSSGTPVKGICLTHTNIPMAINTIVTPSADPKEKYFDLD
jgi:hypothetical protein